MNRNQAPTLSDLLRPTPQGSSQGRSKLASEGAGFSQEELNKAAAVAAAEETIGTMTKEAKEKLGEDMAYLGYCFGWGLNKAAAEFYSIQKQAAGEAGMPTAKPSGVGNPGVNDPKSQMPDNEDLKMTGYPGHSGVSSAIEKLIHGKVLQGAQVSGTTMNTGEQKQSSERSAVGGSFRALLLNKLSGAKQG